MPIDQAQTDQLDDLPIEIKLRLVANRLRDVHQWGASLLLSEDAESAAALQRSADYWQDQGDRMVAPAAAPAPHLRAL